MCVQRLPNALFPRETNHIENATRRASIGDGTPPVPSVTDSIPLHSVSRLTMTLGVAARFGYGARKWRYASDQYQQRGKDGKLLHLFASRWRSRVAANV